MDSNNDVLFNGNCETLCFSSLFEHISVKYVLSVWISHTALPGWAVHTLLNMLDKDDAADIL